MGVKYLSNYLGLNKFGHPKGKYFERFELKNTFLIVDGGILTRICEKAGDDPRLGSDYQLIYDAVYEFFRRLQLRNITSVVIMDGRYDKRKEKIMKERLDLSMTDLILYNSSFYSGSITRSFPIFKTDVIRDVLDDLNILFCRCDFEADVEIIHLAKQLECPVLSQDSDFVLCDGITFIPFQSINKNFFKENSSGSYIECKRFNREAFLEIHQISASHLPLLAVILNNDHWDRDVFRYLPLGRGERVKEALVWLKRYKSADLAKEVIIFEISKKVKDNSDDLEREINEIIDSYGNNTYTTLSSIIMRNDFLRERLQELNNELDVCKNDMTRPPYSVPPEILNLVRECHIPCLTLDMHNFQEFLCRPYFFENIQKDSIHKVSEDLIRGIYGILIRNRDKKPQLKLKMREGSAMQIRHLDALSFPKGELTDEQKNKVLMEIVSPDLENHENFKAFDKDWLMFILALRYCKRKCDVEFDEKFVHAVLLTALILHVQSKSKENPSGEIEEDASVSEILIPSYYVKNMNRNTIDKIAKKAKLDLLILKGKNETLHDISHIHLYLTLKASLSYVIQIFKFLGLPSTIRIMNFISGSFYHSIVKALKGPNYNWRDFLQTFSDSSQDFIESYEKIVEALRGDLSLQRI